MVWSERELPVAEGAKLACTGYSKSVVRGPWYATARVTGMA